MAKEKFVRLPDGRELTFPVDMPDNEIRQQVISQLFATPEPVEIPKPEAGFFGGLKEGITSLGQVPEALRYVGGPGAETRKAAAEAGEADYEFQQLKDIGGIGDLGRFVKEQAGQAVGFLAAPAAAAKTAAMVAPGVAKPFAAGAAFLTTAGAQYFGETATRQAGEQERAVKEGKAPELPDATKIGLSAAGQAGLDLFGFKFFKPLGRLLGIEGKKAAESTAEEIAKTAVEKGEKAAAEKMLGKESIKAGMAKGAAIEGAQEPLQQLLERYGAGLDLANDDAISEYWQSAVAGGLLGAPLGGVNAYAGNVQKGVYDRKFVQSIQDGIMGRGGKPYTEEELAKLWSETEPNVLAEAPMMSLYADEFGNFKTYTPELLEQLGINPEAKAIGYGNTTLGMDKILGQETGNKDIASLMVNVFRQRMADLSNKFRTDTRMSPADRANLLTEYEQAAASYKSFLQMVSQRPIESAANFITRPHPKQKGKFRLVNALTGENVRTKLFESETEAQKYIRERIGKEDAAMARAQAQGVKKAGVAPSATVEETAKETPEQAAMRERAVTEATVKHRFKEDADQVFDLAQEMLDTGIATSYQEAINKASRIVDAQIKADKAAAKAEEKAAKAAKAAKAEEKVPVAPVAPEAGMAPGVTGFTTAKGSTYVVDEQGKTSRTKKSEGKGQGKTYPPHSALYVSEADSQSILEDKRAGSFEPGSASVQLGYVEGNTFRPVADISQMPADAKPVVAIVNRNTNQVTSMYNAERQPAVGLSPVEKRYEEDGTSNTHIGNPIVELQTTPKPEVTQEPTTVAPEAAPEVTPAPPPPPKPEPAPKTSKKQTGRRTSKADLMADAIRNLDPDPESEFADYATAAKTMPDKAREELFSLAVRLKQAYDTAQGKVPTASKADRDAAAAQISTLYNAIDNLQESVNKDTVASMKKAVEANGNAKEADKISKKLKDQACNG